MTTISAEQMLATTRSSMGPKMLYPAVAALAKLNPARFGDTFQELHEILTDEDGRFIMVGESEGADREETEPIAKAIYEALNESLGRFHGPGEGIDLVTFTSEDEETEPCENCGEIHEVMTTEEALQRVRENPEDLLTALAITATNGLGGLELATLAMGGPPGPSIISALGAAMSVGMNLGAALAADPIATGAVDPLDGLDDWLASLDKPAATDEDEDEEEGS